jgi:hypothetical protein
VPYDQADFSGGSSKGRQGKDAVANGGLFWGAEDAFDQLKFGVSVTGSNEMDAVFSANFSIFITGWLLPSY